VGILDKLFKSNMEKMESNKDVEGLIKALKDEDKHFKQWAAGALGKTGDKRAVEPLISALKDKDGDVRMQVKEALEKIGDKKAQDF
jgi:HEAT repeat protein